MLVGLSDQQLGLLVVPQIWRDPFLVVSLAFVVIRDDDAGGRGEVVLLEQGCWSGGGGSVVPLRHRRWEATYLGPRQHGDIPTVDVPQRHVPCCVQQACSSTHKTSLAMVFS